MESIKKLKKLYKEKPGRFYVAECNFQIPLWVEKLWLKGVKSKSFRIHKKIIKRELHKAIKRGLELQKIEDQKKGEKI